MSFKGLRKTSPTETFCRSIKASEGLDKRDSISAWLSGPLLSTLGQDHLLSKVFSLLSALEAFLQKASPIRLGFHNCGYGLKSSLGEFIEHTQNVVLKKGGGLGSFLGAAATSLTGKVENMGGMLDTIRRGVGDIRVNYLFGSKTVINPLCKTQWETTKVNASKDRQTEIFSDSKKSLKRAMNYLTLEDIQRNRSTLTCTDASGEHPESVPVIGRSGTEECLPLSKLDPKCAYKDILTRHHKLNCSSISNRLMDWRDKDCEGYELFFKKADPAKKVQGLTIADWGKQADVFAKSRGIFVSRAKDLSEALGFLVPDISDQGESFLRGLHVLQLSALPSRYKLAGSSCPAGQEFSDTEGVLRCQAIIQSGFAQISTGTGHSEFLARQNQASGGVAALLSDKSDNTNKHSAEMQGTWARSQWVFSYAYSKYSPQNTDPGASLENQLFWPAWRAVLGRDEKRAPALKEGLSFVTKAPDLIKTTSP